MIFIHEAMYDGCVHGDTAVNAEVFLKAYMQRMDSRNFGFRGPGDVQAYHEWRSSWMIACLDVMPPWDYKDGSGIKREHSPTEIKAREQVGRILRQMDINNAYSVL